jgi:hypothetical protein
MTESCTQCQAIEKTFLRIEYLDSFSRVLVSAPSIETEQQIDRLLPIVAGCDSMDKIHLPSVQGCSQIRSELATLQNKKNYFVSANLDATPEGHR